MTHREEIERRIRERGVRVEERLELLDRVLESDGGAAEARLRERREQLLAAVRGAAGKVREALG
jgi:hypothetical protein